MTSTETNTGSEPAEKKGCLGQESWAFGFPFKISEYVLGFQHLFAFFGGNILVPIITGMDPSTALATAGIGTILFHYLTKLKVPVFLGSSFCFLGPMINVILKHGTVLGGQYICAGVMAAACVSFLLAVIMYFVGVERVEKLFPPVVTSTIIIVIGISLTYTAVNDVFGLQEGFGPTDKFYHIHQWASLLIATFTLSVIIFCMSYTRNFFSLIPVLSGMIAGYALCLILRACTLPTIDFQPIVDGKWINLPYGHYYLKASNPVFGGIFMLPKFDWGSVLTIAPLALVSFMEVIGDMTAIGRVIGKDLFADPGLYRTMAADALSSFVAGFFGGPEITTYSQNTGVLATTKVHDPRILRMAALFAIVLSFFGKFGGILRAIPAPVKGAVSLVLFGMIAACGVQGLVESHVDLSETRNLLIVSLIISCGLGVTTASYHNGGTDGIVVWFGPISYGLSDLFICTLVGVVANLVIPEKPYFGKAMGEVEGGVEGQKDGEGEAVSDEKEKEKEKEKVQVEAKRPAPDLNEGGNVEMEMEMEMEVEMDANGAATYDDAAVPPVESATITP